ncbi:MAG TPA: VWA domain-containing protein, partial [Bacteroidetes bacterium]|nr:VWA domain-containing protein [Bacteroidota bacterium]
MILKLTFKRRVNLCLTLLFIGANYLTALSDKTLSPYFMVKSETAETDQLPLKSTSAKVNIAGVIADVTISQVYKNNGQSTLEAIYVFPSSSNAAVYGMKMVIGDRTIKAKIKEKGAARKIYEKARSEGKRTSLLEQNRPNVFTMNLANILPGDIVEVTLSYTELLVPSSGIYEFVYPTVVGPRYSNTPSATASKDYQFVSSPYLKEQIDPSYDFGLDVNLSTGMPIQSILCNTHKIDIDHEKLSSARISLNKTETKGGNRDFILKYSLAGGKVTSGLMLYEGLDENFFLMMVEPPKRLELSHIPAREYIFIVDISGSMGGFPLNTSKYLLRNLIVGLRPTDVFNVVLFAGSSSVLSENSVPANEANIQRAINVIDNRRGGGGTNLLPAMKRAINLPRTVGLSRSMVIVTDGYVHVEKEAFDLVKKNLNKSNVFPFGIGSSVNRHLIEGLAYAGHGEPMIITNRNDAKEKAEEFRKYIQSPVLTGISVDFGVFDAYDVVPISVPDVLAERPVIIFGKWKGDKKGTIKLKGYSGNGLFIKSFTIEETRSNIKNSALRYLWARKKIKDLNDYSNKGANKKEVTDLGLKYNLLTAYTSFIAVDNEVARKKGDKINRVKQALPLPQGVSSFAVGFNA